ncbi:polyprenol phosphomannose-dependent alpha 1,6 mannosyltransferase MptB [Nonomuraea longicatena]|uniref:polyprenol phosphomannose-dependent alpha 1,6 mannosyltransferase MptB n=1 Tax=Nonomuraea longicatena TaxID=83682 RepID=UPI0031E40F9C
MTSQTRTIGPTVATGLSVLLTIIIGALGPSAMVPPLSGPAWQPPYFLNVQPDPHLMIALAALAIVLGGAGLLGSLWWPGSPTRARALVLFGCVAAGVLAFLPPSGSADHLNYAAYGRMVTLGIDPYTHGATDLPGDPIADAVEQPWREEPSVYGPVATAVQALASLVGGDSVRLTVFALALFNAAAFILTGLLIDRFTRHDPDRRLRAALLWTANPLLLYQLVAGMHADTLAIVCMVAALLARAHPVRSGLLLGLGVATKLNAGLVALGPAWELRRRPGRLALMAGAAVAVVAVGYTVVGWAGLEPVTRTSKAISHASFWKLFQGLMQSVIGPGSAYRGEVQVGSLLLIALVAWSLFRVTARGVAMVGYGAGPPGHEQGTTGRARAIPSHGDTGSGASAAKVHGRVEATLNAPEPAPGTTGAEADTTQAHTSDPSADAGTTEAGPDATQAANRNTEAEPDAATTGDGRHASDHDTSTDANTTNTGPSAAQTGSRDAGAGPDAAATGSGGSGAGGRDTGAGAQGGVDAPVVAAVLVVAYLFATPYILPWYDGLAFAMLALVGASAVDRFAAAHLVVLSLAYLPARVNPAAVPEDVEWLRTVVRAQVVPWALLALTAGLVWWAWRAAARARTRPTSTVRPP